MQLKRSMKIGAAKKHVAEKLGVEPIDLTNEELMRQLREDLGIGVVTAVAGGPKGILAKRRVADLLGVSINSVEHFQARL
jgi:dimethylamine--corrinoid protein Co-methyltransferase